MPQLAIPASDRLRFRLMGTEDAQLLWDLDQDPEVMRFLSDGVPTSMDTVVNSFMPRILAFTNPAKGLGVWALEDKTSGEYLGWVLAREYGFGTDYHAPDNVELGWRMYRKHWGKGYATEGARAIMLAIAGQPEIRTICAIADEENVASTAVMVKLGMHYVDRRVHNTPERDYDVVYYEMANPLS